MVEFVWIQSDVEWKNFQFFWTLIYVQMFSTESPSKKCDDIAKTQFKSYFEKL